MDLPTALALTATADAITAQSNVSQTSVLHYQGAAAHLAASQAWVALGNNPHQLTYHGAQSAAHTTTAAALKTAGR